MLLYSYHAGLSASRPREDLKAHTDRIRIAQQALRAGRPSALDGAERTLHIRCGTDIQHKLAIAGFNGDFLWFGGVFIDSHSAATWRFNDSRSAVVRM